MRFFTLMFYLMTLFCAACASVTDDIPCAETGPKIAIPHIQPQ
jgi:hypothetical protein